jgi:hypothetical protein
MINEEQIAAIVAAAAEAFRRILPPGFELTANHDALMLTSPASLAIFYVGLNIGCRLEADYRPLEAVEDVLVSFAENLQDAVTEEITYPWPKDPRLGKSDFPLPNAELREGALVIWFGREEDALTPPIRIPLPAELIDA